MNSLSPVGAYDMSGNVWNSRSDWYAGYGSAPQTNPTGPASGSSRVFWGGGWDNGITSCSSAAHFDTGPSRASNNIGFRLARS